MSVESNIIIGIDATNIRKGGGVTHIIELLSAYTPNEKKNIQIILWGSKVIIDKLPERYWLIKINPKELNGNLIKRTFWQSFKLSKIAKKMKCDILFVPGGSHYGSFSPFVTMHRNLLPFEYRELFRYKFSITTLRLLLLRFVQCWTYKKSNGLVFLTNYSKKVVMDILGDIQAKTTVIPHGLNSRFTIKPKVQLDIAHYSEENPYRLLYVSSIDAYKHQWNVLEAAASLRDEGLPVVIDFVGQTFPHMPAHLNRLNKALKMYDPDKQWAFYHGEIPFNDLHHMHEQSDLAVFASSCETISNILLEKMASGLPIACSDRGPLPQILGKGGVYFNPEIPDQISGALRDLINDPRLREKNARISSSLSKKYIWSECSSMTFEFLEEIAKGIK